MSSDGATISLTLPRAPAAGGQARDAVRAWLEGRVAVAALDDVVLAVSELVTNAVVHGEGDIALHAELRGAVVAAEVIDEGSGFSHEIVDRGFECVGGRGLLIVSRVADRWGVYDGSSHVWFELGTGEPGARRGRTGTALTLPDLDDGTPLEPSGG